MKKFFFGFIFLGLVGLMTGSQVQSFFSDSSESENNPVVVLAYHGIMEAPASVAEITPDVFWAQMVRLKNEYRVISIREMLAGKIPPKAIVLTFDDGKSSDFKVVFPALKKLGFRGMFFPIVELIGKPGYLTKEQIREMASAGMEFGSHTMTHRSLVGMDQKTRMFELLDSKKRLGQIVGREIEIFAYPYGFFDREVEKDVVMAGYTDAFTTLAGNNMGDVSPYKIQRVVMQSNLPPRGFESIASGDMQWLRENYFELIQLYRSYGMAELAEAQASALRNI